MNTKIKGKPRQVADIIKSIGQSTFVEVFLMIIFLTVIVAIATGVAVHLLMLLVTGHFVGAVIELAIIGGIIATFDEKRKEWEAEDEYDVDPDDSYARAMNKWRKPDNE